MQPSVHEQHAANDRAEPARTRFGYSEWDRREWVGEGQEPDALPAPAPLRPEPRWTKWEWVGEGQGSPGPRRGATADRMPEGESGYSGFRHNPGMAHWRGGPRLP